MFEILLVFYLFTGLIKDILSTFGITITPDLTLLSGASLILITFYFFFKEFRSSGNVAPVFKRVKPLLVLIGFFIWCAISIFLSDEPLYNWNKLFLSTTILIPFISIFIYKNKFDLHLFSKVFIGAAFFVFVFYFITSPNVMYYYDLFDEIGIYRLDYSNMKPFGLSSSLKAGIGVILCVWYIKNTFIKTTCFLLLSFFVFYTGSRGAFIFLIITLSISLFNYNSFNTLKSYLNTNGKKVLLIGVLLTLIIGSSIQIDKFRKETFHLALYRYQVWFKQKDDLNIKKIDISQKMKYEKKDPMVRQKTSKSVTTRLWHYKYSVNKSISTPMIFLTGIGFGNYGNSCCDVEELVHPHNFILETLIETGAIGLIIPIYFLFLLAKEGRNKKQLYSIAICLIFFVLNMMKSWSIIEMRDFFTFAAIMFFIYQDNNRRIKADTNV